MSNTWGFAQIQALLYFVKRLAGKPNWPTRASNISSSKTPGKLSWKIHHRNQVTFHCFQKPSANRQRQKKRTTKHSTPSIWWIDGHDIGNLGHDEVVDEVNSVKNGQHQQEPQVSGAFYFNSNSNLSLIPTCYY